MPGEGPQVITRHGEDVAVVVDIADVFMEVEAGRKADFGRAVDFEAGR
jgi:prevent-host-death family protein